MSTAPFSVCVYGGSRPGRKDSYSDAAASLGREIAKRGWRMIYGGGDNGLMGAVSRAARAEGGAVLGVVPESLVGLERSRSATDEVIVVADMHARKAKMAELSDAFVAMPGGFGTLEEVFEMATWQQLGFHRKAVGVLNSEGYYDSILSFISDANAEGFISDKSAGILLSSADPTELLENVGAYAVPEGIAAAHHATKNAGPRA